MRPILFFSDNRTIFEGLKSYLADKEWPHDFGCSPGSGFAREIRIRDAADGLAREYGLIVSAHCKQIFPATLVQAVLCVNLHPGFNPDTRGWYPQSFALAHGLKVGFTVHVMDEQIDNGPIIFQREIEARPEDTSKSLYERILAAEVASFDDWLPSVVNGTFRGVDPGGAGNYHSRSGFDDLCRLDLDQVGTFRQFYNRLRATSFSPFRNAWFEDGNGRRIFIRIETELADDDPGRP